MAVISLEIVLIASNNKGYWKVVQKLVHDMNMFEVNQKKSKLYSTFRFGELLYHGVVREVRKKYRSPIVGLVTEIVQSVIYVVFFLLFMKIMGNRQSPIRGNEVVYILTGVFLFLIHIRAIGAVMGTKGPLNPMNLHTSVNSILTILSASIATIYTQTLAFFIILFATNVLYERVEIYNPKGFAFAFFISWIAGIAIGNLMLSLSVFFPNLMKVISQTFQRVNMIFSGKFFVPNMIGANIFWLFTWNPLFHVIDYSRDAAFINYTATRTNINYALWATFGIFVVSFMIDHWARKYASESWKARA